MQAMLIENNGNEKIAYDSLILEKPEMLGVLKSKLAMNILRELSKNPSCAIDIAKKLRQHEQKVYYYFKKLEKTGIIYSVSTERRYGMIAKIYSVVSPVVALKLFEKGTRVKENFSTGLSPEVLNFFSPFIEDGRLNAKIIIGDSITHGRFDTASNEAHSVFDTILFLGSLIVNFEFPNYKIDTEIKESDFKDNLILIGNNKTNSIIDKINNTLPVYFDPDGKEKLISRLTGRTYSDPRTGVICKSLNPFNEDSKILVIGGIARRGTKAASIALTQNLSHLTSKIRNDGILTTVVQGLDKDGDGLIDSVKFLE